MSDAFERVLKEPGSTAARRALLLQWHAAGDERAELVSAQLELAQTDYMSATTRWRDLHKRVRTLVAARGREFAGPIAELVDEFTFVRGLVERVTMSGVRWTEHAPSLFTLAPVQQLRLTTPFGDLDAVFGAPELSRIVVLDMAYAGDAFGDRGAVTLARSRFVTRLRYVDLQADAIGEAGVDALAASRALAEVVDLNLRENPVDPTPVVADYDGARSVKTSPLAAALEAKHGARPWLATPDAEHAYPPDASALCVTD